MLSLMLPFTIALCIGVSFVNGSPIKSLEERQDTCGNTGAVFDEACWTSEQVAFYLSDPTTGIYP